MKTKCVFVFYPEIFLMFLQFTISSSINFVDSEYCGFSKSTQNTVKACPVDKASWIKAANKLGCSNHESKCGGNLKYHCAINPWQNETVEVCAPATSIRSGHCAEYNTRGGKIQEFYLQNCKACKRDYMSTEAYKYQECYLEVYKQRQRLMQQQTDRTNQEKKQEARKATTDNLINKISNKHKQIEIFNKLKQRLRQQYGSQTEQEKNEEHVHQEMELKVMADINSGGSVINRKILQLCVILLHFKILF